MSHADDLQYLEEVCANLKLPSSVIESLSAFSKGMMLCERSGYKSPPARREQLDSIVRLSKQLNKELQSLERCDQLAIHREFELRPIRLVLDPADPIRKIFSVRADLTCENVLLLGDSLLTLSGIAQDVKDAIKGRGDGAPAMARNRAPYVLEIALYVREHMTIGRGGDFQMLCDAVFSAAGVRTSSDASIRYFLKHFMSVFEELSSQDDGG